MAHVLKMVLFAFMITGCAGVTKVRETRAHAVCAQVDARECISLTIGNFSWERSNPLMRGLDQPPKTPAERQERVQFLPGKMHAEYEAGGVGAAAPRTFLVFVFEAHAVAARNLGGFTGKLMLPSSVEDVTGTVTPPTFDPASSPGKLTRAYRITASAKDPGLVRVQFPRTLFRDGTSILVCSEDRLTVYPNRVTANEGHWIHKDSVSWLLGRGTTSWKMFFLSKRG